jgi:hypothetical protein
MSLWLNTLHPTRVEMLTAGPTEREQKIVGAHFAYWKEFVAQGTALLVGRTQDAGPQTVGLAVSRRPTRRPPPRCVRRIRPCTRA